MALEFDLIPAVLAVCFGLVAAITDVRSRRIPNWLTGSALVAGIVVQSVLNGWRGLLGALAAALIAGGIFMIFHLGGGMGAGDVKLIAGLAAIEGLSHTSVLLVFTSLAGGAMAIALALMRRQLKQTLVNVFALAGHHKRNGLQPHPRSMCETPTRSVCPTAWRSRPGAF